MRETFGSVCHGAGRLLSRTAVRKGRDAREEQQKLEAQGILVRSESRDGILEELPEAYKNVDEVIEVVHQAGLTQLPRFSGRNVGNKVLARFLVTICRLLSPRNRFGTASRTRPT